MNPVRLAVPAGVVTFTFPVLPDATTARTVVDDNTLKLAAAVPPKLTKLAPVRSVPVMVTGAPVAADVGVKEVMTGAGTVLPKALEENNPRPNVAATTWLSELLS